MKTSMLNAQENVMRPIFRSIMMTGGEEDWEAEDYIVMPQIIQLQCVLNLGMIIEGEDFKKIPGDNSWEEGEDFKKIPGDNSKKRKKRKKRKEKLLIAVIV